MELVYADYANKMKALANRARKEMMATQDIKLSPTAKKTYEEEVRSLEDKLNTALLNATRERHATRLANIEVKKKRQADPDMDGSAIKKASQQAVTKARQEVGAVARSKRNIHITDREWEAIQAGAVSATTLRKILANTDSDSLRQRAMPKASSGLTKAQITRIKTLSASNLTLGEIAKKLGVSTSTVSNYLKGEV
jgi:DNA-binding CsgD family transcriptional regulator